MGIVPLYIGWDKLGNFYVASELKALEGICPKIQEFLPGHYLYSEEGEMKQWYKRDWMDFEAVKDNVTTIKPIATGHGRCRSPAAYVGCALWCIAIRWS